MINILFSSPAAEDVFLRTVNKDEEVGGWLICVTDSPPSWPGKFNRKEVKRLLGCQMNIPVNEQCIFIETFIVSPNIAARRESQWSTLSLTNLEMIANYTAQGYGASTVFFHSHPNGEMYPSDDDIMFANKNCKPRGDVWFAIARPDPLDIAVFNSNAAMMGMFHSWKNISA